MKPSKKGQMQTSQAFGEFLLSFLTESVVFSFCCLKIYTQIFRSIILRVISYWCENGGLKLWEEYMHSVFENSALRKIFGPKWEKVTDGWRKFHNEKLQDT